MSDKPQEKTTFAADCHDFLKTITLFLLCAVLLFPFCQVITVDGSSMVPTLDDHDQLLLQKAGYEPEPGDIVVLRKDFAHVAGPVVKRIVATEGQTVEIDYRTSTVYVDGDPLDEPYLGEPMVHPTDPSLQQTVWTVPEGSVFVLGDNRNNSYDSRHMDLGPVDERLILGKVLCVLFPFRNAGGV
ncbi:MAG: signal peptidase I [Ruminiclostridium sp.]|nr:signal peptidase I [Ruminiclostridium sp.]